MINNMQPGDPEFYNRLTGLRDTALEASYDRGFRANIGGAILSNIHAGWQLEDGGIARLHQVGTQLGEALLPSMPTCLDLYAKDQADTARVEVTEYRMALEREYVEVYRAVVRPNEDSLVKWTATILRGRYLTRKYGMEVPEQDDLVRLHNELERGASGVYHRNPRD
jgi:hypothetical protein